VVATALHIAGVTKRYGSTVAVRDADLVVDASEFFSILGPSGSGKTTLLRMTAGFIAPDVGRILIGGDDVTELPPFRRPTNMVFQNYALFPHLTVANNLAFGLVEKRRSKKEIASRIESMLALVRLVGMGDRMPSQLSGGQQQRVALGRALINDPSVLLLDEPLGALDAKLRKAMQLELKRIQREVGMTFVYVTHDQDEALTMSDRLAVMNEGVIEQVGTPREVYEEPATLFVGGFVGEGALLDAKLTQSLEGDRVEAVLSDGTRIRVRADSDRWGAGDEGMLLLRPEELKIGSGVRPSMLNVVEGTLETLAFEGSAIRCVVTRDAPPHIEVMANAKEPPRVTPGERVWVSWPEETGRLLR
jgi:spermidine/putrescine transport system ATP-binding protein